MPSKGPSSVSESAPQKTGKEPGTAPLVSDSKNMANPKSPSSVSESAPSKTGKEQRGTAPDATYGKKRMAKDSADTDATPKKKRASKDSTETTAR